MQQTYPVQWVGQSTLNSAHCLTYNQPKHTQTKLNQLPAGIHPQTLRVGVKKCNGADNSARCYPGIQHPQLYTLTAYQTLRPVHAALLVDGLYNCPLPVWVWNVLLHIPNGTKKIYGLGGVL